MSTTMTRGSFVLAAIAAAALAIPLSLAAQQSAAPTSSPASQTPPPTANPLVLHPKASPEVPRMPDGHPDMNGVWQGGSNRVGNWEETNSGEELLGQSGPLTKYAVNWPQPKPPYQEWAAKKVLESYKMRGVDEPMVRCEPPGTPRTTLMGLFPMQIVQTPNTVVLLFEVFHIFRVIPIDAKHPDDLDPSYMGDSVGRWEGDTLVVDVTGFNDKTWLSGTGTFHSEKLHVVERYTRVDLNTIVYSDTVEDPVVLTGPWTRYGTIMLRTGTRLREYECVENNVDLQRYEQMLKDPSLFMRK